MQPRVVGKSRLGILLVNDWHNFQGELDGFTMFYLWLLPDFLPQICGAGNFGTHEICGFREQQQFGSR
jgi:hypothetical protein